MYARVKRNGAALVTAALMVPAVGALTPSDLVGQQPVVIRSVPREGGWLGLSVLEEVGVDRGRGFTTITVSHVVDGGPSHKAGLQPGDLVVRVNGQPAHPAAFNRIASGLAPGERMRLEVRRDGDRRELVVTAGAQPASVMFRVSPALAARVDDKLRELDSLRLTVRAEGGHPRVEREGERVPLGRVRAAGGEGSARNETVELRPSVAPEPLRMWVEGQHWIAGGRFTELNPDLAAYFEIDAGLLITEIIEGTPVAEAGVRAGDVLIAADGRPIRTLDAARAALQRSTASAVRLTLVRHGERLQLTLGG